MYPAAVISSGVAPIKVLKDRFADSLFGVSIEVLKPDILSNVDSVGIRMTRMFKQDI